MTEDAFPTAKTALAATLAAATLAEARPERGEGRQWLPLWPFKPQEHGSHEILQTSLAELGPLWLETLPARPPPVFNLLFP